MLFKPDFVDLGKQGGAEGRSDAQWGWLEYVRPFITGMSVLDVGSGLSKTKERLYDCQVTTQEIAPECGADITCDISQIASSSYGAVICLDVIEHVKNYGQFAYHLARIARRYVFLTTPGAEVTLNDSPYHFHEFHPWDILQLLEATGLKFLAAWACRWSGPAFFKDGLPSNCLTTPVEIPRSDLLTERHLHPIALLMN